MRTQFLVCSKRVIMQVLLPVVALGRAQELLLILEEHWARHRELQRVPIYQCSGLAKRALSVYQTYIEMMNDAIKRAFQVASVCPAFSPTCAQRPLTPATFFPQTLDHIPLRHHGTVTRVTITKICDTMQSCSCQAY